MWTGFTTLVCDGEGGVRHETGGEIERERRLGPGGQGCPVSFRKDTPAVQCRARERVAAWRAQHPDGTTDEMVAELGPGFPKDYGPFLRGALYIVDKQRGHQDATTAPRFDEAVR